MTRSLTRRVKQLGRAAGFDLVRIAPAQLLTEERERYLEWLAEGRAGDMRWMTPERAERSADPRSVLPTARSVICVAVGYRNGSRPSRGPREGKIARYAWGRDYHAVLGDMLERLTADLGDRLGGEHRAYVDTGPLMDKAVAARAGLGWYGKHTNLITPTLGSYVLLGEVVTSLDLEPDRPLLQNCGSCRLCATACPTGALADDYTIDARRCISYLTIEHRGPIPRELRAAIGAWVFGCDICQDVCPPGTAPYTRDPDERRFWLTEVQDTVQGREPDGSGEGHLVPAMGQGARAHVDLRWLLHLSHQEYLDAFRGTAIRRAKVWMLRRNAAIALGNVGGAGDAEHLAEAMAYDVEPVVRSHAAWGLGRLGQRHAGDVRLTGLCRRRLETALSAETEAPVREEIDLAIAALSAWANQTSG